MALVTLEGVKEIGGFKVGHSSTGGGFYSEDSHVFIRIDCNRIAFQIQEGPIKEHGVNGCQVTQMIQAAKLMIQGLNGYFPCEENTKTIKALEEAIDWQQARTENREKRGVEGTNQL